MTAKKRRKPSAAPGTQMMAFRVPTALGDELRGAANVLEADQAAILRQALERELSRLRRKYNRGEPFPNAPSREYRSRRL